MYWVESVNHQLLTYLPKRIHFSTKTFKYEDEFGSYGLGERYVIVHVCTCTNMYIYMITRCAVPSIRFRKSGRSVLVDPACMRDYVLHVLALRVC